MLLRLILNDVADQHRAVEDLFQASSGQFAVSDVAIIEVVFVLARNYGLTRPDIAEVITGLISLPQINCNRSLFERALPIFTKNPSLSFEDCCLSIYAQLNDAEPLWTFDKKLADQISNSKLVARH